jgi:thiamine pyrophosphate-dependent acetolactate synthase large subunit-like protein
METVTGSELLARALKLQGVEVLFYVMGGPMLETEAMCIKLGIRAIDTRHEQAASFEAHAWTRAMRRPAVCIGCSGPGATNLLTGVANAFTDASPLVAIGGASPRVSRGLEAFQEIDQLAVMKPVTKWAERIYDAQRIPEIVATALRQTMTGRPGPVYIDMPGDVLSEKVAKDRVAWPAAWKPLPRPLGDSAPVREAIAVLRKAERPLILGGAAASGGRTELRPSGLRGGDGHSLLHDADVSRLNPEDHALSF